MLSLFSVSRSCHFVVRATASAALVLVAFSVFAGSALASPDAVSIATGDRTSCTSLDTGRVLCWGDNTEGQVGDGSNAYASLPQVVVGLTDAKSVTVGHSFACALRVGGTISCWGSNAAGALGNGSNVSSSTPVQVSGISSATSVVAGNSHVCALLGAGTVRCWGSNAYFPLATEALSSSNVPLDIAGVTGVKSIGSGDSFSCALLQGGSVKCWGDNIYGKLGFHSGNAPTATPGNVVGIETAKELFVGAEWACIKELDDDVTCWSNVVPGVPSGPTPPGPPWTIPLAKGAKSISGALGIMCVVLANEQIKCWGHGYSGQRGEGPFDLTLTKSWDQVIPVVGTAHASAVATSDSHSCAIVANGQVKCWGRNGAGQLGIGEMQYSPTPVPIGLADATAIAGTCAIREDAQTWCWGGYYEPGTRGLRLFDAGYPSTEIAVGPGGLCTTGAAVRCIGNHLTYSGGLATISDTEGATETAVGYSQACAVLSGEIACWGNDYASQLGDGSIDNAVDVSAGNGFGCAVIDDGSVKCWGKRSYLGDGTTGDGSTAAPVTVTAITDAEQVFSGTNSSCVILEGGSVRCWGDGSNGMLGNGSSGTFATTSVPVTGISNAVSLSIGSHHACAVLSTGGVSCWGSNGSGELGDGTTTSTDTPQPVPGFSNAVSVTATNTHTCVLVETGGVFCWGDGSSGQTGIPYEGFRSTAALVPGLGSPFIEPAPPVNPRPIARPELRLSKAKLGKTLSFEVTCFTACTVSASLKPAGKRLKLGSKRFKGAWNHKVKFKISKKVAKAVKKARKRGKKISLTVKATNATGETRSQTRKLK